MKKKTLIYALLASAFITVVASCDDANTTNNNTNTPSVSVSADYETPEIHNYRIEDNELSKKVYAAISKSFNISNVTYEDFLTNTSKTNRDSKITFDFSNSIYAVKVELDLGELFLNATINTNGDWIEYHYKDGEWFKGHEYLTINGEIHQIIYYDYNGFLEKSDEVNYENDGKSITITSKYVNNEWIYEEKHESTYENGKQVSYKNSKYINNEWLLVEDSLVEYEGSLVTSKSTYRLTLNPDGSFDEKYEASYNEAGNLLSYSRSKYINNEWVKEETTEKTYDSNGKILTSSRINFNTNFKEEDTYDSNGNKLTHSYYELINNEWVKRQESICIDDDTFKTTMFIRLNQDSTFNEKDEYTYDDEFNVSSKTTFKYQNNEWVPLYKEERTYDEKVDYNYINYRYKNNKWLKTEEGFKVNNLNFVTYNVDFDVDGQIYSKVEVSYNENNEVILETTSIFKDDAWVYDTKEEYTYTGNTKTETYSVFVDGKWVYEYQEECTYNEDKMTSRVRKNYSNGAWQYAWMEEYRHEGNLFIEAHYNSSSNYKTETIWDDGTTLAKISYRLIENEWVKTSESKLINEELREVYVIALDSYDRIVSKYEALYDELGNLVNEERNYYVYEKEYVEEGVYKTIKRTYDDNNKLLNDLEIYYYDGKVGQMVEKTYDDNGNMVAGIASEYVNNEWVLSAKYEATYDEFGNIASEKKYIYENGEWVEKQ